MSTTPDQRPGPSLPRRYALVGTGSRARMYTAALAGDHADRGALVALCDPNQTRMAVHNDILAAAGRPQARTSTPERFARMLREESVDEVIVCTVDSLHADYIAQALEAGCDVITEKPLTADLDGLRRILRARERHPGRVTVAFNYRYNPVHRRVAELLRSGAIGEVGSVHLEWLLDLRHGADYFRRWHRDRRNSGGLLVHKACHHFDLVNWWLGARPRDVFAWGSLFFYGEDNGRRRGLARDYERGRSPAASDDPFALRMEDSPDMRALYLEAEHEDGYLRDRNVFGPGITIEDDIGVLVRYDTGARLSYHLAAYSPWEGYRVAFTGSTGRLELEVTEVAATPPPDDAAAPVRGMPAPKENTAARLVLHRHWRPAEEVPVAVGAGAHGGGDVRMLAELFDPDAAGDRPDADDGAQALLTGLAANAAMDTGRPVDLAALLEAQPPHR